MSLWTAKLPSLKDKVESEVEVEVKKEVKIKDTEKGRKIKNNRTSKK